MCVCICIYRDMLIHIISIAGTCCPVCICTWYTYYYCISSSKEYARQKSVYVPVHGFVCVICIRCRLLRYVAVCCSVLRCVAARCSVLQCVAVCCGVLRCVAVCYSVLHRLSRLYCLQLLRETHKVRDTYTHKFTLTLMH